MRRARQWDVEVRIPWLLGDRLRRHREDAPPRRRLSRRLQQGAVPQLTRRTDPGLEPQDRRLNGRAASPNRAAANATAQPQKNHL